MSNRPRHRNFLIAAAFFLPQQVGAQTPTNPPVSPTVPPSLSTPPIAIPPALTSAPVSKGGAVKVGGTLKPSRGLVTDVDKGDNGCYLTVRDEKNFEYIEVGSFAICTQKPPLKGKRVELEYSMETIMAGDCYGDSKCKRTETVPFITSVKIVD